MPCDTQPRRRRNRLTGKRDGELLTKKEVIAEVEAVVRKIDQKVASGAVKVKVGPQGAVAFEGITDEDRDGVTDACIYRRMLVTGSSLARTRIQQAEMLAGRPVNRQAIAQGWHSHDGGKNWHHGH